MKSLISLIVLMSLVGCKGKYHAPIVEDCIFLTELNEYNETISSTCFCINGNMDKKYFKKFVANVTSKMSNHSKAQETIDYVIENKRSIIKSKEYELDAYYCNGYTATNAAAREKLENWAEGLRIFKVKND